MKRKTLYFEINGAILLLLGAITLFILPNLLNSILGWNILTVLDPIDQTKTYDNALIGLFAWFGAMFTENVSLGDGIFFAFFISFAFCCVSFLLHLILLCIKKRFSHLLNSLIYLALSFLFLLAIIEVFAPRFFLSLEGASANTAGGLLTFAIELDNAELLPPWGTVIVYLAFLFLVAGFILLFIGLVFDMARLLQTPKAERKVEPASQSQPQSGQPSPEEIKASIYSFRPPFDAQASYPYQYQLNRGGKTNEGPFQPSSLGQPPILVQYINTAYPGTQEGTPQAIIPSSGEKVPLDELKGNILGTPSPAPKPQSEGKEGGSNGLTADEVRAILAEELAKGQAQASPSLTADQIRSIIRQELSGQPEVSPAPSTLDPNLLSQIFKLLNKENASEPNQESEEQPVEPSPQEPPAIEEPPQEPDEAIEEPSSEEPVEEEVAPIPTKRKVGEINPNLPPHEKIVRIPFPTRILSADKTMQSNYNELKSEFMSYGVKSRVSNSGDTFRLHKVTFCKLTVAGKSLKLYLALDPSQYHDSTFPILDAGHKGVYKDIPLVFKVKSDLSLKRAKQLIAEVMEKNGLRQGKVEPHNYARDLLDYKPSGFKEEEGEE